LWRLCELLFREEASVVLSLVRHRCLLGVGLCREVPWHSHSHLLLLLLLLLPLLVLIAVLSHRHLAELLRRLYLLHRLTILELLGDRLIVSARRHYVKLGLLLRRLQAIRLKLALPLLLQCVDAARDGRHGADEAVFRLQRLAILVHVLRQGVPLHIRCHLVPVNCAQQVRNWRCRQCVKRVFVSCAALKDLSPVVRARVHNLGSTILHGVSILIPLLVLLSLVGLHFLATANINVLLLLQLQLLLDILILLQLLLLLHEYLLRNHLLRHPVHLMHELAILDQILLSLLRMLLKQ